MRQTTQQIQERLTPEFLKKIKESTQAENEKAVQLYSEPGTKQPASDRPLLSWGNVAGFIDQDPGEADLLFKESGWQLSAGKVGAIFATGGTGKTFLGLQMAVSLATGIELAPFKPAKTRKVLYLCGEDDISTLHRRVNSIFKNMPGVADQKYELLKNFYAVSLVGEDRVLVALDENGNPTTTAAFDWLNRSLEAMPGVEVLFIDPLSRFYGLAENQNEHATAWISALERLQKERGITVLFMHHESKRQVQNGNLAESAGRGASGFRDGVRQALSMATMSADEARKLGIEDYRDFVQVLPTKLNDGRAASAPEWFKRGDGGVLLPYAMIREMKNRQSDDVYNLLCQAFTGELIDETGTPIPATESINFNELVYSSKTPIGKALTLNMKSVRSVNSRRIAIPGILAKLASDGKIIITEERTGKTKKRVVTLPCNEQESTISTGDLHETTTPHNAPQKTRVKR